MLENGILKCDGIGGCYQFETSGYPCEHQQSVCELVHTANGTKFPGTFLRFMSEHDGALTNITQSVHPPSLGFTPRDVVVRWHIDFMHLAYRPSSVVPKEQLILFHRLANTDLEGPRLRCQIPESLRIEEPSPMLSALDRLSNYNKEDVDLTNFDGLLCTTFASDSTQMTEEEELEMFDKLTEELHSKCSDQAETLFASSTDDADLPQALHVKTRVALHQTIEECCAVADHLDRSSALRNKLEEFLSESRETERNKRMHEDEDQN